VRESCPLRGRKSAVMVFNAVIFLKTTYSDRNRRTTRLGLCVGMRMPVF